MERSHVFNLRLLLTYSLILAILFPPMFIDNTILQPQETTITHSAEDPAFEAYTPHSPILIDDDDGFDDDWPGEGTKDRPFIIEGLHIKSNVYCIKIVGTSSYFVIRDCLLENRDAIIDGKGIEIERVRNGAIEGCRINGMSTGISLLKSQDMTISSCEITRGKGGVRLEKISSTEVYGCLVSNFDYGIYMSKVDSSSLTENIVEITTNSIIVDGCGATNIAKNVIQTADRGLSLYSSDLLNISSNVVGDVRTSAFVKFTHNSSILDNVIQNGDNGIFMESSNGNDVSNNYISAMRSNAVYVIYSRNNIFARNEIVDNDGVGVYLYDSANCAVYANYIGYNLRGNAYDFVGPATKTLSNKWDDGFGLGNAWGGISTLDSYSVAGDRGSLDRYPRSILTTGNPSDFTVEAGSTSSILWNASAVRPHYYQVEQDDIILEEGAWDGNPIDVEMISLDPGIYNYTLLVNTTDGREMSHSIQIASVDTTHPVWILSPVDRAIEHGNRLAMMIEASDLYGISMYWVNDTIRFTIDDEGNLEDTETLALGTHPIEVRAYDPSLNFISSEIIITVQDTIAPEISGPEDITYDEGDAGNVISWTISDRNPSSYQVYRNGELVAEGGWTESFHILELSVDGLSPGTHIYRLELFDLAGNSFADEVTVVVNPKTTDTTSETPLTHTTETTSTSPSTSPQIPTETTPANGTMLITGIAGVVVLGVAAAVLMMKRR